MDEAEEAEVLGEIYWSTARCASYLSISRRHVRRLVNGGRLAGLLLGGAIWVRRSAAVSYWERLAQTRDGRNVQWKGGSV